jgi:hypothetical protein
MVTMGSLKPGATYIYERDGKNVYAREVGARDRTLIGYDYDGSMNLRDGLDRIKEDRLWNEILVAAKINLTLQEALNRVKVLYELSKENE